MNVSIGKLDLSFHFSSPYTLSRELQCNVPSPSRYTVSSRLPLPRRSRPQSPLRCLQIVGSAGMTPPLLSHRIPRSSKRVRRRSIHGWGSFQIPPTLSLVTPQSRLPTSIPPSEIFGFVCSFPLLEDISMTTPGDSITGHEWSVPSTSPKFTGTLNLKFVLDIRFVRCLVEPPGNLHFTMLDLFCRDAESVMHLVSNCSETLESFKVRYFITGASSLVTF